MIKNCISVLIFIFIFCFIFFISVNYTSDKNKKKINKNRDNVSLKIKNILSDLPLLKNDTQNIINFNSGYETDVNTIKRNFWNLFKKND